MKFAAILFVGVQAVVAFQLSSRYGRLARSSTTIFSTENQTPVAPHEDSLLERIVSFIMEALPSVMTPLTVKVTYL